MDAHIPSSAASNARSSLDGWVLISNTDTRACVCVCESRRRVDRCIPARVVGAALGESREEQDIVGDRGEDI